jgi:hypothetical protein
MLALAAKLLNPEKRILIFERLKLVANNNGRPF